MDKEEWNTFAKDYYESQKESSTTIVEDIVAYLKSEDLLPAGSFADVAGGAGRYLPLAKEIEQYELIDFSEEMLVYAEHEAQVLGLNNCQFILQDLASFLQEEKTYELVFSAANPALASCEQLEKLRGKATRACLILRVVSSEDNVFVPLERHLGIEESDPNTSPTIMDRFETYLAKKHLSYKRTEFTYDSQEEVTASFLRAYYEEMQDDPRFQSALQELFKNSETIQSTNKLTYRLLTIY
ncbi:class I SAM-dependent methyltransferase [Enterococcus mundtii]|uniref:class I SAM-dependent methyltransferase n=1 Tax=Enterococcus mundtii TaxID=53346 RepID=UPI001898A6F1|nr:class I SAM-dependent methyltransferase [Enterococcus mundtii]MBO1087354.1 class I SAM-dependent methyltransferase [Enterococcus mundtii]MDV7745676.1 class I SAM-dependent methyltransferase [Enterococcus mundtii]